jgi:hypothetical protein
LEQAFRVRHHDDGGASVVAKKAMPATRLLPPSLFELGRASRLDLAKKPPNIGPVCSAHWHYPCFFIVLEGVMTLWGTA